MRANTPVDSGDPDDDGGGLSSGIIVALALVGVALLVACVAGLWWCTTGRGGAARLDDGTEMAQGNADYVYSPHYDEAAALDEAGASGSSSAESSDLER